MFFDILCLDDKIVYILFTVVIFLWLFDGVD